MSLLFNMLSRLVTAFLPRSNHLLISWLYTPTAVIFEVHKITVSIVSPSIYHEVMEPDAMILIFWILSQLFSFSSFTFIKRLFISSSLSAVREGSSAYLRLFVFLPAIYFSIIAFVAYALVSYLRHQRMSEFLTIRNYCQDWCQEGFPLCFLIEVLWFQVLLSL